MVESAWFFGIYTHRWHVWLQVLNDRRPADVKSLYVRKGDAKDAASVSEFVKLLVQWFQRADEKLCLERILTMLRVSSGFLFCGFWQVPSTLFDWVDKNIDFGHVFLRCGFFWHQEILRWCFGPLKQAASFSWETQFSAPWRDSN